MKIIALLIACAVMGVIGMAIGDLGEKKNGPAGFLLGALLGPIGWIIVAIIPHNASAGENSSVALPADPNAAKISQLEAQLAELKAAP